jgi:hypothetical protein
MQAQARPSWRACSSATEAMAMQVVMEYERAQGRQVYDVHEKNWAMTSPAST